jgi:hypothetical protein
MPFSLSRRRWLWNRSSVFIAVIILIPVHGTRIRPPAGKSNAKEPGRRHGKDTRSRRIRTTDSTRRCVRNTGLRPTPAIGRSIARKILRRRTDMSVIAKMDASKPDNFEVLGQFWMVPVIAKMDALKVNILKIPLCYP